MSTNVLPDSRLKNPTGTVMADWPWQEPDGTTRLVRIELEPFYCINCPKLGGWVPRGTMSFVSWLCLPCAEKWGEEANAWHSSDREFWDKVHEEMLSQYGRALSPAELSRLAEQDRLGSLALLIRESPYKGG